MIPILRVGKDDDIDTMKSSSDPNIDDDKATAPSLYWKVLYSLSIRVTIGVPDNLPALLKQQIRWRKSFYRSLISTGEIFWRDILSNLWLFCYYYFFYWLFDVFMKRLLMFSMSNFTIK
jgi:cellulose synthase/poly-beta-1,6-N-acetylglucosamine synthase-like glycosyltransferase